MSKLKSSVMLTNDSTELECCKSTFILREKVMIVGDATVGKTALVHANLSKNKIGSIKNRENLNIQSDSYMMTTFPSLNVIEIANTNDAMNLVDLFVYDCPGQIIMKQVSK